MQLDNTFVKALKPAIMETWQQIAWDVMEMCEDDNEQAMEMCLDADRLLLNGNSAEAHALAREAHKLHGYQTVLKFLSQNIQLL